MSNSLKYITSMMKRKRDDLELKTTLFSAMILSTESLFTEK